tara:strand:- start:901 stop:1119 length:219 start_codon:yes stop_codon:yes gene_type:complete
LKVEWLFGEAVYRQSTISYIVDLILYLDMGIKFWSQTPGLLFVDTMRLHNLSAAGQWVVGDFGHYSWDFCCF